MMNVKLKQVKEYYIDYQILNKYICKNKEYVRKQNFYM